MHALHDHLRADDEEGAVGDEVVRQSLQVGREEGEFKNVHFLQGHEEEDDAIVVKRIGKKRVLLGFLRDFATKDCI